jgi:SAM-dependent methyltransferase
MRSDQLCCPCKEKRPLVETEHGLACCGESCSSSEPPRVFPRFAHAPILIAFDRTDTICSPAAYEKGAFYFPRNASKFMEFARRVIYGKSPVTVANCARFVDFVKGRAEKPSVLVIGSGSRGSGTEKLWEDAEINITGTDIYCSPSVDYIADAHFLPFADASFDGVWIQAVLEHVASPGDVVAEIERVLKPGGAVYAETPFMQQVHEAGYDFTRYSVTGHRWLFRNFEQLAIGGNGGPAVVLAWAVKYFAWSLFRKKAAGVAASIPFFLLARVLDPLMPAQALWDGPSGVFFLGFKGEKGPLPAKDLPRLYEGFQG